MTRRTPPPAIAAPAYLRLWLDDARVGCGWRAFVLVKAGRKFAHLVEPVIGATLTLPLSVLSAARPIERPRWSRIARQIAPHAGDNKRLRGLATRLRKGHP